MRKIITFNDLDLMERIYPHCMRCDKTGDALDANELMDRYGKAVPLEFIKKMLVCERCGQKDEIILKVISNEAMAELGQRTV